MSLKTNTHSLCNGVWCNCPVIEVIKKEYDYYIIITDDFKGKVIFEYELFYLKNYLHFEKFNGKLFTLSDVFGNKIILTKNDVDLIKDFLNKGEKYGKENTDR